MKAISNLTNSIANMNAKRFCGKAATVMTMAATFVTTALADGTGTVGGANSTGFYAVTNPIVSLINSLTGPILGVVGAIGILYCILLGVKFAKAEEPQDREKAKQHLKNAIIGFVLIFILIFAIIKLLPLMIQWVNTNAGSGTIS